MTEMGRPSTLLVGGFTLRRVQMCNKTVGCGLSSRLRLGTVDLFENFVLHGERLAFGGKRAAAHFLGVLRDGLADGGAGFRVALHESRREAAEHADEVVED